jgi:hypothetical protein
MHVCNGWVHTAPLCPYTACFGSGSFAFMCLSVAADKIQKQCCASCRTLAVQQAGQALADSAFMPQAAHIVLTHIVGYKSAEEARRWLG